MARSSYQHEGQQAQKSKPSEQPAAFKQQVHRPLVYIFAMVAALGSLLYGYDTGLISGAELYLRKDFSLSPISEEVMVSAILIGGTIGAAISGKLSNALGRRLSLMIAAIIFAIGAILTAIAPSLQLFIACRILVGLSVGITSMVTPVYITEISPPEKRGVLVTFSKLSLNIAIPIAYGVGLAFAHAHIGWRPMFAVECIPGLLLAGGMFFLPDTPRWLAHQGRWKQADQVLERIAGSKKEEELSAIHKALKAGKHTSIRELFVKGLRMALLIGVCLALFQQVIGSGAIFYYAPTIFHFAGFTSPASDIFATIVMSIDSIVATIVALFLLDRLGRRPLLLLSLVGILFTLGMIGIIFLFGPSHTAAYLVLICLMIFIFSYGIGIGPIFGLMCAEIFPTRLRSAGVSISFCFNWAATLLVSITFLSLSRHLGNTLTFWLYALFAIAAIGFCWLLVPETRGKSLEQIEHYWKNGRHWSLKTNDIDGEDDVHSRHAGNSENNNRRHDGRRRRSREL